MRQQAAATRRAGRSGRVGCYPGSFDPPTIAHLEVAEVAVAFAGLTRLDIVISREALAKVTPTVPSLADRLAVLQDVAGSRPWLGLVVTDLQLVVDIAAPYDAVVMGADKWRQVSDPSWYGANPRAPAAVAARDAALARLPRVLVAPRGDDRPDGVELLPVDDAHLPVSSSAVRAGQLDARTWMLPEAAAFDAATGAWTDPDRYTRRVVSGPTPT